MYKEIDGVATTRYSVGGLSPYSDYEFRVVAVNNIGRGPPSESIEAKTAEQAPSTAPRQVRGHMLSTTTAVIHWDEPEEANGQIMGYRVYYTMDSTQHVNLWEKQIVRGSNFVTIQGLIPNKTYYIKVLAYTSVGDGPLSPDLQIIAKTGGGLFFLCVFFSLLLDSIIEQIQSLTKVHTPQLNFECHQHFWSYIFKSPILISGFQFLASAVNTQIFRLSTKTSIGFFQEGKIVLHGKRELRTRNWTVFLFTSHERTNSFQL